MKRRIVMSIAIAVMVLATPGAADATRGDPIRERPGDVAPPVPGESGGTTAGDCDLYWDERAFGEDCVSGVEGPRARRARVFAGRRMLCKYVPATPTDHPLPLPHVVAPGRDYLRVCLRLADAANPMGEIILIRERVRLTVDPPPPPPDEDAVITGASVYLEAPLDISPALPWVNADTSFSMDGGGRVFVVERTGIDAGAATGDVTMRAELVRSSIEILSPDRTVLHTCQSADLVAAGDCVYQFRHSTAVYGDDGVDVVLGPTAMPPKYLVATTLYWSLTLTREDGGPLAQCGGQSTCELDEVDIRTEQPVRVAEVQTLNRIG